MDIKSKLLLSNVTLLKTFIRNKMIFPRSNKKWPGGEQYYKFTYYPRYSGEKDPPITPSKLLMVQRVKPYFGNPYWEKQILTDLKLDNKMSDVAIVENSAQVCADLWKIKHLIKITPITFPDGEPKDDDYLYSYLNEYGEFRISPSLKPNSESLRITEELLADNSKLDPETVKKRCLERWVTNYNWTQLE